MSYNDKCINTNNMATICYKHKNFDSFINRCYYSFFQKVLHILDDEGIKLSNDEKYGSHINTFNVFLTLMQRRRKISPRDVIKVRSDFEDFKKLRTLADYNSIILDKKKADEAKNLSKKLRHKLKIND
ncbi:hypothetical protein ACRTAL_002018 [Clostridium perfringens]|uniref:hypothetical protein n=1 Tax=Clostridium perfringens TaxID=1502 RepID=UPI0024BC0D6C|nr:hypothetical protein [Clostridium perfringens]MDK0532973.1 hypothetical protein [Clostridium perfringens]MDM0630697.1 hypothetical protein [Clostridium perfringens]MDM0642626.1 hypothetical protein [Clostridium perfringens]MDU2231342.1 hypothetical protein [Clostridium perfringens]